MLYHGQHERFTYGRRRTLTLVPVGNAFVENLLRLVTFGLVDLLQKRVHIDVGQHRRTFRRGGSLRRGGSRIVGSGFLLRRHVAL